MKYILIFIISLGLVSCVSKGQPAPYHDAPTVFVVKDIQDLEGMSQMTSYYIEVVDANGLVHEIGDSHTNLKFWICDSIGKYKLGQPIRFDKFR